jgi:pimeloyl-ACP methyl ester carboxylesterase
MSWQLVASSRVRKHEGIDMFREPARSIWRKGAAVLAAGAIAVAAFAPLQAASGTSPTAARAADATKPTIVLVHGSYADAGSWAAVTAILQNKGYHVVVPAVPLRSLIGDSEYLAAYLQQATEGPLVLVGHSYGGALISNVGLADPDVKSLVFVEGFAPDEGETLGDILGPSDSALNVADPTTIFDLVSYPGAENGDMDVYLKEDFFNEHFAPDVPPAIRAVLAAGQRPATMLTGMQPAGPPAWKTLPSWFVIGTEDQAIPAETQRAMAERAGGKVTEVKAGHLSMVVKPVAVSRVIEEAARAGD